MYDFLQVTSVMLVAVAMVPALAHALELPGKLRLSQDTYFAVQRIYYPGFTVAGFSEPLAIVSTIVLLVLAPSGTADFWLTLVAWVGLVGAHAVYWLVTHPVNNFWLQNESLSGAGSRFFSMGSASRAGSRQSDPADWTTLRDRWEYSHVIRAALVVISFMTLLIASSSAADR